MNRFGDWRVDTAWPVVLGLMIGVWRVIDGGEPGALVVAPALCWSLWQVARWAERSWRDG